MNYYRYNLFRAKHSNFQINTPIRLANLNRVLSSETKSKISTSMSHSIYVYTPDLKFLYKFTAITIAKLELKIAPKTIKKYCLSGKIYKDKYRFSYTPLSNNDTK